MCRKTAHRQLVRFGCVENGARRPPGPGPGHLPKGPPSTGQIAHHQLAKFECRKFTTTSQVTEEKQVRESRKRRPAPPGPAPPPPVCGQGPASTGQLGVCRKRPPGTTKARPANWRAPNTPKPVRAPAPTPKSAVVDWRVPPTARPGPREARPSTAPLQAPGTAGALDGEVLTNKSSQGRADAQRLVATRLLDRVHDPLGHFSRLQRIYPRAR